MYSFSFLLTWKNTQKRFNHFKSVDCQHSVGYRKNIYNRINIEGSMEKNKKSFWLRSCAITNPSRTFLARLRFIGGAIYVSLWRYITLSVSTKRHFNISQSVSFSLSSTVYDHFRDRTANHEQSPFVLSLDVVSCSNSKNISDKKKIILFSIIY